jgi:hypothetical protein
MLIVMAENYYSQRASCGYRIVWLGRNYFVTKEKSREMKVKEGRNDG